MEDSRKLVSNILCCDKIAYWPWGLVILPNHMATWSTTEATYKKESKYIVVTWYNTIDWKNNFYRKVDMTITLNCK